MSVEVGELTLHLDMALVSFVDCR